MFESNATDRRSITDVLINTLVPYARNARTHSKKQIRQIADSIERFGFTNPILVSNDNEILAGHDRVEAAKLIGLKTVLTLILSDMNSADRKAYILADNKLALNAGGDKQLPTSELQGLIHLEFDVELTGFDLAEIDLVLDEADEADPAKAESAEDVGPPLPPKVITNSGDIWQLGRHRLICGDTREVDGGGR